MAPGEGEARAPVGDLPKDHRRDRLGHEALSHQREDPHASEGHADADKATDERARRLTQRQGPVAQLPARQRGLHDGHRRKQRHERIPAQHRGKPRLAIEARERTSEEDGERHQNHADGEIGPEGGILMALFEALALDQGGGDPLIAKRLHDDEIDLGQRRQTDGGRLDETCQ